MASNREERMQQRLRGAQRRQVKDVDFGLTFPALPAITDQAQQSVPSQSISQPVVPLSAQSPPSSGRSRRPATIDPGSSPPTTRNATNDANISAKRRKLNSDQAPSSSTRTTRGQSAADIRDGSVEEEVEPQELELPSHGASQRIGQIASLPSTLTEIIAESPANDPGSGHRMQVSLDESTLQSIRLQDGLQDISLADVEHIASSPAERRKRKMGQATPRYSIPSTKQTPPHQSTQDDDGDLDELSPDHPRGRGRKRKQSAQRKQSDLEVEEETAQYSAEEAEEIDDDEAAAILHQGRGRGRLSNHGAASPDLDEPTPVVAKKKRGKARKITTPAQQRQPKPVAQAKIKPIPRTSNASNKSPRSSQIRPGSPIPIPVHRFTKRLLYDDDASDADILNSEIPYIKRGGVNVIDVLSQVCQEIVGLGLDTTAEMGRKSDDRAKRREYKTKWSAIDAFGRELQNRLLEYTINLDNRLTLEKRVREEQKKRLSLREDILRVRNEREQVALRMDEVRIKHETESNNAQERDSLNNTIHDIELAIERGKEQHPHDSADGPTEMAGIELLLKRVAGEVSNKSDSGGILKQVKEFNAFLERAALALETKRS